MRVTEHLGEIVSKRKTVHVEVGEADAVLVLEGCEGCESYVLGTEWSSSADSADMVGVRTLKAADRGTIVVVVAADNAAEVDADMDVDIHDRFGGDVTLARDYCSELHVVFGHCGAELLAGLVGEWYSLRPRKPCWSRPQTMSRLRLGKALHQHGCVGR